MYTYIYIKRNVCGDTIANYECNKLLLTIPDIYVLETNACLLEYRQLVLKLMLTKVLRMGRLILELVKSSKQNEVQGRRVYYLML